MGSTVDAVGRKRRSGQVVAYGLPLVQDKVTSLFLHLAFVFYPYILSCGIDPSTSPSAVLYFFLFPCGVSDRIDTPYCACRKRRLKQGVALELPLSGAWATYHFPYLALSSILTSFPVLCPVYFSLCCPLLLSTVALRYWK
ncbi:hypothetical protein PoB_000329300 [Plakobranchus ocellatus]|uniref:Uncharacterized protein n=1 Tax=Plakobranchus ocellatus TaxID=259542 RepID=A0AAV3Y2C7_9GAST|nr:hypothetical protein PoB_000329300 [Plakobranchus ocellatus]